MIVREGARERLRERERGRSRKREISSWVGQMIVVDWWRRLGHDGLI